MCLTVDGPRPIASHPKRKLSAELPHDITHWSHTCMGVPYLTATSPLSHNNPALEPSCGSRLSPTLLSAGRVDSVVDWLLHSLTRLMPHGEPSHPIFHRLVSECSLAPAHTTEPMLACADVAVAVCFPI